MNAALRRKLADIEFRLLSRAAPAGEDEAECEARTACARNLLPFVQRLSPTYQAGWVHRKLASALERFLVDVLAKKSPRLMVFMPPRHGKSELVSRYFPAWTFGNHPDISIIGSSYSNDLISRMNRDVQRIIDSAGYCEVFPRIGLNAKNIRATAQGTYLRNSDIFEIVGHKGVYRSAGVGAGITGMGADILNIDDPVKDAREANSETVRKSVWEWYTSTAYTRLSPGGGVLLTMTRWHVDDLAGRLLEAMRKDEGDRWEIINFPAIATADEEHRKEGEALHPERWPLAYLDNIRQAIGEYNWYALYQQEPTIPGGALIKSDWWRYWEGDVEEIKKRCDVIVMTADTAYGVKDANDFSVFQCWGFEGNKRIYLLDQVRGKWGYEQLVPMALRFWEKHSEGGKHGSFPAVLRMYIENKASGQSLIQQHRLFRDKGVNAHPWNATDFGPADKVGRVKESLLAIYAGQVILPGGDGERWVDDFISECAAFSEDMSHVHDDQVDCMTMAVLIWRGLMRGITE